jgi:4-oxalocrotonate tautomerase
MASKARKLYDVDAGWEGCSMPEIYVHAVEGRSLDQKRALVREITAAVVKNFNVPAESVMVQIIESAKENKAKGGVLFSER